MTKRAKIYRIINKYGVYTWKQEYPEKTTDLSQVTAKLYRVSSTPRHEQGSNSQL
jgi:hypothetical protein